LENGRWGNEEPWTSARWQGELILQSVGFIVGRSIGKERWLARTKRGSGPKKQDQKVRGSCQREKKKPEKRQVEKKKARKTEKWCGWMEQPKK